MDAVSFHMLIRCNHIHLLLLCFDVSSYNFDAADALIERFSDRMMYWSFGYDEFVFENDVKIVFGVVPQRRALSRDRMGLQK